MKLSRKTKGKKAKTEEKETVNWFKFILGLGLLLFTLYSYKSTTTLKSSDLTTKTIIVENDIHKQSGKSKRYAYRIDPSNFNCYFIIETAGGIAANWKNLDDIKKNDSLICEISVDDVALLNDTSEKIPIYSLIKNNGIIYNLDDYNNAKKAYDRRWNIVFLIFGSLLTLRGANLISDRVGNIIGISSFVIIIVLKIMDIW